MRVIITSIFQILHHGNILSPSEVITARAGSLIDNLQFQFLDKNNNPILHEKQLARHFAAMEVYCSWLHDPKKIKSQRKARGSATLTPTWQGTPPISAFPVRVDSDILKPIQVRLLLYPKLLVNCWYT